MFYCGEEFYLRVMGHEYYDGFPVQDAKLKYRPCSAHSTPLTQTRPVQDLYNDHRHKGHKRDEKHNNTKYTT